MHCHPQMDDGIRYSEPRAKSDAVSGRVAADIPKAG